jgi:hypothetical protein
MLLPDIPRGPTWTPEHLNACLARFVARLPKPARLRFFETWERRHGRASAANLNRSALEAYRLLSSGSRSAQP